MVRTSVDEPAGEIVLESWQPGYQGVRVQRRGNGPVREDWAEDGAKE